MATWRFSVSGSRPCGAGLLGTLPLYPPFPGTPMDPSPYLPLSRLAYNELFVDPVALPEFAASEDARSLAGSAAFVETLAALRSARLVDYDEVARMQAPPCSKRWPERSRRAARARPGAARLRPPTPGARAVSRASGPARPTRDGRRTRSEPGRLPPLLPVGGIRAAQPRQPGPSVDTPTSPSDRIPAASTRNGHPCPSCPVCTAGPHPTTSSRRARTGGSTPSIRSGSARTGTDSCPPPWPARSATRTACASTT